jgi:hypothetical protein
MRPIATLIISIAMALGAIGLAVAAPGVIVGGDRELARAEVQAASGAVSIANSRAGQAVFSAVAMRPGQGVNGTVTIGNDGDRPGRFAVQGTGVQDVAGPNGGRLSERVELVLFDVTNVHFPVTVYAGAPAGFAQVDLGVIAPGHERDYLVVATLPDGGLPGSGGAGDNRFQGSSLSLGFAWSATNVANAPTPTPTPTATPTTPSTPVTPAPTTPATPTPPVALADALGMPASTSCVKGGKLTLRVKAPAGAKVLSAIVKVNGRVKAKLKGAKAAKPVTLRGLKRTTKLSITVKASDKRTYSAARTYRACKR